MTAIQIQQDMPLLGDISRHAVDLPRDLVLQCCTPQAVARTIIQFSGLSQEHVAIRLGFAPGDFNTMVNWDTHEERAEREYRQAIKERGIQSGVKKRNVRRRYMDRTIEAQIEMICGVNGYAQWDAAYKAGELLCQCDKSKRKAELLAELASIEAGE